ncbi:MAG TPA: AAA family ATPase [Nakamurella sp.]
MRLLERDAELTALGSYWAEALVGRGHFLFLGGEAGAGKSSVAREFSRRVAGRGRILVGACDAGATPRALGPLVDVAEMLGVQAELDDPEVRRASLFPRARAALGRSPTLLLLEDVHWADEATLDLLRYLGRRMDALPVLVIATFREDEVARTHPLATVMGDLASAAGVSRMQLPLLTAAAVAELARESDRDVDVAALHRSTDGNPFFVTEVLAAVPTAGATSLPTTVRDAVAARASRLSVSARRALEAAAVVGSTAEIALLRRVSGEPSASVDECVEGGVLLDQGPSVTFRHELARQAILDALPPGTRVDLHRRVLVRLTAAGSKDHRRLAEHAVACGEGGAIVLHAPRAAELAGRLGSHREAAEHLRTALRHGDSLPLADRAGLLERLSYECSLTSRAAEALEARQSAVALRKAAGDAGRLGVDQRWLSRLSWLVGRNADADRYAEAAVATLEPLGAGADLAMAYSNMSNLRVLGGSTEEALVWGRRAVDAARAAGDRGVEAHALNNVGTALLRRGDLADGRARLDESLGISLADGLDEHAARAWSNIGAAQASKRMLGDAELTLRRGMTYCAERDLDTSRLCMQGWLAGVSLEQGNTGPALQLAQDVLAHPQIAPVSRIPALLVTGLAAIRRGDPAADAELAELHALASGTAEPLRLLPVALLRAEAAWTAGRAADIVGLTDDVWTACADSWEPWIVAELAWWRALGGAIDDVPFTLPMPFALMRAGRAREASEAWTELDRPFWAALALAAGGPAETSEAVAGMLRLGATASAQAVRRDLALRGLPVPRGPRTTARVNAAGLTARQLEILRYLVDGLSDAEIAARLTLSHRTVGHHVSAVLRKLDVPSRSRAAAAAQQILRSA